MIRASHPHMPETRLFLPGFGPLTSARFGGLRPFFVFLRLVRSIVFSAMRAVARLLVLAMPVNLVQRPGFLPVVPVTCSGAKKGAHQNHRKV